jgi:hypothetical protein
MELDIERLKKNFGIVIRREYDSFFFVFRAGLDPTISFYVNSFYEHTSFTGN